MVNEFCRADSFWRTVPKSNAIRLSVSLFLLRHASDLLSCWKMGFEPHSTINIKWISIPVDHHCVGNRLRFSFVDRREKDSFVYIVTSGRSILVALCVVCLEAWLKLSYVETRQNQNGSRQRWHLRPRRRPLSLTPCFSGVFKRPGGQKPFQRFCGRRKNR